MVSLRQNEVGTGFISADAILPKGHKSSDAEDDAIEKKLTDSKGDRSTTRE